MNLYHGSTAEVKNPQITKLWHLSSFALYNLLEEELETGKITWPEEQ